MLTYKKRILLIGCLSAAFVMACGNDQGGNLSVEQIRSRLDNHNAYRQLDKSGIELRAALQAREAFTKLDRAELTKKIGELMQGVPVGGGRAIAVPGAQADGGGSAESSEGYVCPAPTPIPDPTPLPEPTPGEPAPQGGGNATQPPNPPIPPVPTCPQGIAMGDWLEIAPGFGLFRGGFFNGQNGNVGVMLGVFGHGILRGIALTGNLQLVGYIEGVYDASLGYASARLFDEQGHEGELHAAILQNHFFGVWRLFCEPVCTVACAPGYEPNPDGSCTCVPTSCQPGTCGPGYHCDTCPSVCQPNCGGPTDPPSEPVQTCGGILGETCADGYECKIDAPPGTADAQGTCVRVCGGIAGLQCPDGYSCHIEGKGADLMGVCVWEPPACIAVCGTPKCVPDACPDLTGYCDDVCAGFPPPVVPDGCPTPSCACDPLPEPCPLLAVDCDKVCSGEIEQPILPPHCSDQICACPAN